MDNLIGKRLDGRYQITELIGVGGMANVYKAADMLENRVVAVKVLRDEFIDNDELVRRFKNESKAIGLLAHPNIVRVFDVNFTNAIQYIVMEYLDGITLKQYIDAVKPLSWKDTVHFAVQILRALQHAHDRGIVHRDIKPQNIMLLEDGSIKVMDFGIARFSRSETRTITDKAIGSVHYISPEQAKGDITDSKADLYSVGIMLYEMLTGKLPFESDTPVQVAIKQISDEATRPREILPSIPEGLEEITLKAMAKDPARRYQSASQMLRDIDDFKRNPSIVFSYKYLTTNSTAITRNMDKMRSSPAAAPRRSQDENRENGYLNVDKNQPLTKRGKPKKSRRPLISTYLVGAFVCAALLCTMVLIMFMLGVFDPPATDIQTPDFRNMKYEDVKNNELYADLKFKIIEDYKANTEIGVIYDQKPLPGKQIKSNSEITLYISLGGKDVVLIDVVGMQSGVAKEKLQELGVKVRMETDSDLNYEQNVVIRMRPEAGNVVPAGEEVVIVVNVLQALSESQVPDLIGKRLAEAQVLLSQNNLSTGTITYQDDSSPRGTVIGQDPEAGKVVLSNTAVDLVISSGPPPTQAYNLSVTIPDGPGNGAGGHYPYEVRVIVNGADVATFLNASGSSQQYNLPSITVTQDNTIIEIQLVYNGSARQYLTYTAQVSVESCVLTSGTPSNVWPWPGDEGIPPGVMTQSFVRKRGRRRRL